MTNREKALELCNDPKNDYKSTDDLCVMMAEWKEKEMLDCAVSAYCECCDTKECEDYCDMGGECDWKMKFEKKLLKNLKK